MEKQKSKTEIFDDLSEKAIGLKYGAINSIIFEAMDIWADQQTASLTQNIASQQQTFEAIRDIIDNYHYADRFEKIEKILNQVKEEEV